MTTPTTPTTVEPGQIWRDNDQRTKGSGEFVVMATIDAEGYVTPAHDDALYAKWLKTRQPIALVRRSTGNFSAVRFTTIRTARLLNGTNTQRGYTYLGMQR